MQERVTYVTGSEKRALKSFLFFSFLKPILKTYLFAVFRANISAFTRQIS